MRLILPRHARQARLAKPSLPAATHTWPHKFSLPWLPGCQGGSSNVPYLAASISHCATLPRRCGLSRRQHPCAWTDPPTPAPPILVLAGLCGQSEAHDGRLRTHSA